MSSNIIVPVRPSDRFGYYQIGDVRTYSKMEFIDLQTSFPADWHWNYNNEFFSKYNWQQEPIESINELYRRRAQKLRNDNDYLILHYSGGYDSSNILYSFLDNNIPLDEILIYYSRHDGVSHQYQELSGLTRKKTEQLQKLYPKIKIRYLDYADFFISWDKNIANYGYGKDLVDVFGSSMTINRFAVDLAHTMVPEWENIIESGKKLAFVIGVDKPVLRYFNGQWIFNFQDGIVQSNITPLRQMIDDGSLGRYEFFYWDPCHECAQILIKQSHLVKQKYDFQARLDFSTIPGHKPFRAGYGWEIDKMDYEFTRTIYPRLFGHGEGFYIYKNSRFVFGNRDQWFFQGNHDLSRKHREMYQSLGGELYSHRRSWYSNNKDIMDGIVNCISPDYII